MVLGCCGATKVAYGAIRDAAREVVRRTGRRSIPQFVIDGRWVQPYRVGEGFLYDEMKALFGIPD